MTERHVPIFPTGDGTAFTDLQGRFSFALPDGWGQDVASNPGLIVQYRTTKPDA